MPEASQVLPLAAQQPAGSLRHSVGTAGRPQILSFRRIPARSLIITVARSRDAILVRWWQEFASSGGAFALFALTAGILTTLVVGGLRRQQRANAELAASEEQLKRQSSLLQLTLENMGEGLAVFAQSGQLVAFNSRFVELLELPPDLSTDSTLMEVLEFQQARGDFGPDDISVQERFDRMFRELPIVRERVTRSGRTLEIRRQAMPGGVVSLLFRHHRAQGGRPAGWRRPGPRPSSPTAPRAISSPI